jgi:4-hydroxy-3-methylbut-2-enyl diphosphate reductase
MAEAQQLAEYIKGTRPAAAFYSVFQGRYSEGFDVTKDLTRIGVVNQTTMLASDTQAIADFLKQTMLEKYGSANASDPAAETSVEAPTAAEAAADNHFADTRDTLCYATLDNQSSVLGMLDTPADIAIVVGGYNSSNTSHLVELCEQKMPTFFIRSEDNLLSSEEILHYDFHEKKERSTRNWLPDQSHNPSKILLTSGASCPDSMVESVIRRLAGYYNATDRLPALINEFSG